MSGSISDRSGDVHDYADDYLTDAGFMRDEDAREAAQADSDDNGTSNGGEHFVRGVYKRDDVVITFEVNTDTLRQSGTKAVITHPQVCIVEGPKGRVACSAADEGLQLRLAEELS